MRVLKRWLTKLFIIPTSVFYTADSIVSNTGSVYPLLLLSRFIPYAKYTVCVCQMLLLTWEIPEDRYRRIGVHMWKPGRVPSLLCYTEDTESVSWASPGTCSQTPALLVCTVSVYRNWRLLSSAWKGAVTRVLHESWYSLAEDARAPVVIVPSQLSLSNNTARSNIRVTAETLSCLWDEAVNAALVLDDERRSQRLSRITLTAWRQSSDPICLGI